MIGIDDQQATGGLSSCVDCSTNCDGRSIGKVSTFDTINESARSREMKTRRTAVALSAIVALALPAASPARAVSSVAALRDARVPAMCRFDADRLVNGQHPDSSSELYEWLDLREDLSTVGNLRGGRAKEAIATLQCSVGASGAAHYVVVYSDRERPVKLIDVGKLTDGYVRSVAIRRRTATIRIGDIQLPGEAPCCGSGTATIRVKWNPTKGRYVVTVRR